jgi:hypothetical protein
MSDIDRLRDAEEQEYVVEVWFFVNASSNKEATLIVDKAINTAKLNELEAWQIENTEEM